MTNYNVSLSVEKITPEIANEYLTHNSMNRPLRMQRVKLYAHQMENGKWRVNIADPITFSDDGVLLNGQHRLNAIIKAGIPIQMAVARGADKADFVIMDTGKLRSAADVLSLSGVHNGSVVAASINFYLGTLKRDLLPRSLSGHPLEREITLVTNEDILNEYESSAEFYQTIAHLAAREYKKYRLFASSHFGGVAAFLVKEKHHDLAKVEEFFVNLNDGIDYKYLSYLRRLIINSKVSYRASKNILSSNAKLVMLSKAWNYFISGEDRKMISYRIGDRINFE